MSLLTVVGVCADALGHARHDNYGLDQRGAAWHQTDLSATPASAYHVTTDRLPVEWRHRRMIGEVAHLERSNGNLWAVAEVDTDRLTDDAADDLGAGSVYWSPESFDLRSRHGVDAELHALGLTPQPATIALPPVRVLPGDLTTAARHATGSLAACLTRAVEARSRRRTGDRIRIAELDPPPPERINHRSAASAFVRPPGRIEFSKPYAGIISVR